MYYGDILTQRCTMCKTELLTQPEKNNSRCRLCHAAYMREWRSRTSILNIEDYSTVLIDLDAKLPNW